MAGGGQIIAVSGLCGAGKSTAVKFLAKATGGEVIYFGATVLRVLRECGLSENSANEQTVRIDLRSKHGAAYLAMLEMDRIKTILLQGRTIFVDAIYVDAEFECLSRIAGSLVLIAIEASFENRLSRVSVREVRPMSEQELRERDCVDLKQLNVAQVLTSASIQITNDGAMTDFEAALNHVLEKAR